MDTLRKWSTSIVAIIISFWLFFPLGFILIYIRLSNKYGKYFGLTKMLFGLGLLWLAFGVIYLGASISEPNYFNEYLPAGLFVFVLPGIIMFFSGNKRKNKCKVFDKYITYIKSRKEIKIDSLCSTLNVDFDTANNILSDMISRWLYF